MSNFRIIFIFLSIIFILSSCTMIGGYRPPLSISEVSGVYEGTNFGFFSRLELYPNGKGIIAYREMTEKKKSEIDIHLITFWKTKENNGIELKIKQNHKSNKKEEEIVCTGGFFFGMLHLSEKKDEESKVYMLHLMKEADLTESRQLSKEAIAKFVKNQTPTMQ